MSTDIFKNLNKKQMEAVKHTNGPSVIMAGAGSGKTRVLVYKVLYLIKQEKIDPNSIIMITFTNKAAQEMKERVHVKLGFIGTFHSFCANVLRRKGENIGLDSNFSIYDDEDQKAIIKDIVKKADNTHFSPAYFLNRISAAKNQLIDHQRYLELFSDYNAPLVAGVYKEYQKQLKKNNAADFDDLIMKTVELFIKFPEILQQFQLRYKYILVDEFQDTNYAQYTLTRLLGERYMNLTCVGDFSQSIYSWRGADIRNLEKFKEDFSDAHIFHLEENYRSTQSILDFAYEVISKNQTHPILNLFTKNREGEKVEFINLENEQYEAVYVANRIKELSKHEMEQYSSFAVLYRTNAQSRVIEEAFLHIGIPYVLIGGTRFYERKEIKDVLSYLRLLVNPIDEVAADRVKKIGKKKWQTFADLYQTIKENILEKDTNELMNEIFQATGYLQLYDPHIEEDYARLENIKELRSVAVSYPKIIDFLQQVALVESEYSEEENKLKHSKFASSKETADNRVRLMTLHQAKGLEFPYVFIVGVEEGILPHSRSIDDLFTLEEERRLFYVGITRAKKKLYITFAKRRFIFGRRGESMKSRFIGEENEW